jgi:hypothetical protein
LYKDVTKEDFSIIQDGIIQTSVTVDSENSPASDGEIELWKQGELELYSAHYSFFVQLVKEKEATEDELRDMFGVDGGMDMMEMGGDMAKKERMYNFLKDDLAALEKAIEVNNQEETKEST